jgi:hypothetical protein
MSKYTVGYHGRMGASNNPAVLTARAMRLRFLAKDAKEIKLAKVFSISDHLKVK